MSSRQRPAVLVVLLLLVGLEFLLVAGYATFLVVELAIDTPASLPSAIALTVIVAIAAVWVGAIVVGLWRGRAWTRGAGIVWQVLQFAIGIGALQGAFAQPVWGWPLTAVALAAFLLLMSRPVVAATQRDARD